MTMNESGETSSSQPRVRVRRVYDPAEASDGYRVLVDRLWPRGMTTEHAGLDLWLSAVAPSHELRKRWHQDPHRLDEFAALYVAELDANPAVADLVELLDEHPAVTLLYAARDRVVNHAVVLQRYLLERAAPDRPGSGHPVSPGGDTDG